MFICKTILLMAVIFVLTWYIQLEIKWYDTGTNAWKTVRYLWCRYDPILSIWYTSLHDYYIIVLSLKSGLVYAISSVEAGFNNPSRNRDLLIHRLHLVVFMVVGYVVPHWSILTRMYIMSLSNWFNMLTYHNWCLKMLVKRLFCVFV